MTGSTNDIATARDLERTGKGLEITDLSDRLFGPDGDGRHLIDRLRDQGEFARARSVLEVAAARDDGSPAFTKGDPGASHRDHCRHPKLTPGSKSVRRV